jgi:hypothetical protein
MECLPLTVLLHSLPQTAPPEVVTVIVPVQPAPRKAGELRLETEWPSNYLSRGWLLTLRITSWLHLAEE